MNEVFLIDWVYYSLVSCQFLDIPLLIKSKDTALRFNMPGCRMSEESKAIYGRAWDELVNKRNLDIVDELFAPNYVFHDPHFPMNGRDSLRGFATSLHSGSLISGSRLRTQWQKAARW